MAGGCTQIPALIKETDDAGAVTWRLDLARVVPPPSESLPLIADAPLLRQALVEGRRREIEALTGPLPADLDGALAVAATHGAVASMPFLDILESEGFRRTPCLCCATIRERRVARQASGALATYLRYFDAAAYLRSRAFVRLLAALLRDPTPDEVRWLAAAFASMECVTDATREINRLADGGLCVVQPTCATATPGTLWVYSTADGRKLLKFLAKRTRATYSLATADGAAPSAPRYRHRMYVIVPSAPGTPSLEQLALEWMRRKTR